MICACKLEKKAQSLTFTSGDWAGWVKTFAETLSATGTVNGSLPASSSSSVTLCISDNSLPFSPVELSLIIAETSENVTGDETDIERISPTIHRTEVRIVSTPPHSWVRNSNLSLRIYVSIFLRKKGRRHLILHALFLSSTMAPISVDSIFFSF